MYISWRVVYIISYAAFLVPILFNVLRVPCSKLLWKIRVTSFHKWVGSNCNPSMTYFFEQFHLVFVKLTSWHWRSQFPPVFYDMVIPIEGIDQNFVDIFSPLLQIDYFCWGGILLSSPPSRVCTPIWLYNNSDVSGNLLCSPQVWRDSNLCQSARSMLWSSLPPYHCIAADLHTSFCSKSSQKYCHFFFTILFSFPFLNFFNTLMATARHILDNVLSWRWYHCCPHNQWLLSWLL